MEVVVFIQLDWESVKKLEERPSELLIDIAIDSRVELEFVCDKGVNQEKLIFPFGLLNTGGDGKA